MGVIRGSGTRGAVKAVRQILEQGGTRNVVFTPDGPRGPRRVVEPTMIRLAGRTGLPIVPVGFAFRHCKRLRSWDRFALPRPFTRAVGVIGHRIEVPADLDAAGRRRHAATACRRRWTTSRRWRKSWPVPRSADPARAGPRWRREADRGRCRRASPQPPRPRGAPARIA